MSHATRPLFLRGAVRAFSVVGALALSIGVFAAPAATVSAQAQRDIVDTAVAAGSFGTLASALQAGNLVDTLKGPGPFTVFAPSDAAFQKVPQDALNQTLQNQQLLRSVLTYHVTAGRMSAADLAQRGQVPSVQGGVLQIGQGPAVNGVRIVQADIQASNGVIHVIDTVLTPPGAGNMAGMAPAPSAQGAGMGQPGTLPRSGVADTASSPLALGLFGLAVLALGGFFVLRRPAAGRAR